MFGWFSSKCPVRTSDKTWTERRMRWLAERIGLERLRKARVILPTANFFPEPYRRNSKDVSSMLSRVGYFMGIDTKHLKLEVIPNDQLRGAVGQYQRGRRPVIRVVQSQLADAERLVSTLAHELAHDFLLGGEFLKGDEPDGELITDLLTIFLGLGVFTANSIFRESQWWMSRQGYLLPEAVGYALALFAFMRGEESPDWAKHLTLGPAEHFAKGLRFLRKTNDSLFHPETILIERRPLDPATALTNLQTGSATVRLATLWDLRNQPLTDAVVVTAVARCLRDRDPDIPSAAALALGQLGEAAAPALSNLIELLPSEDPGVRAAVAFALGVLARNPDEVVPWLCEYIPASPREVLVEASRALARFGRHGEAGVRPLALALMKAFENDDPALVHHLADVLTAVTADAPKRVREILQEMEERDERFCALAVQIVEKKAAL